MGHFGKGPRYGGGDRGGDRGGQGGFGGKKFGGKPSFGGGRPTTMHPAVCGTCGKACEVPFRPTGNRPIFCKDCFQKQGGKSASGPRERTFERPRYEERRKPDFRSERPDRPEISTAVKDKAIEHLKTQLSELNSKVDRVVTMLQSLSQTTPVAAEVKEITEEAVEAPKKPAKKAKAKKKK